MVKVYLVIIYISKLFLNFTTRLSFKSKHTGCCGRPVWLCLVVIVRSGGAVGEPHIGILIGSVPKHSFLLRDKKSEMGLNKRFI